MLIDAVAIQIVFISYIRKLNLLKAMLQASQLYGIKNNRINIAINPEINHKYIYHGMLLTYNLVRISSDYEASKNDSSKKWLILGR